ncbi:hypothetical protein [Lysinibacter cavernae]|uniref:Alpha-tubulin suppressor-like RCC1 family protein n=2 Tax=Lysinibacter cavernae TaxID=1640652 RepID=A0A7X5R2B6_9MICO|nr:hypothetical protein [Lysinibacter cavernae]NIH54251.1 alpha-tubulin suppressor-like RCC1 family protein [Lysinibacter cavernae]
MSAALVWGSATAAQAIPLPDNGPEAGGTTVTVPEPQGPTFATISAGFLQSVAILPDNKAYAWGWNSNGQLGNGTNTDTNVPVLVQTPSGVTFTHVSTEGSHSLAVGSDGNTYAWGHNAYGQLGNGTNTDSNVPILVQAPAGVTFTTVDAGGYYSLAIGSDGNTYAWGHNAYGQLGDGSSTNSNVPVMVLPPAGVTFTDIAAGTIHSLAIGSDGNTYAWGDNVSGQLGDGTNTDSNVPLLVQAPAGVTFTNITAGIYFSLAIGSDGNTYSWGDNLFGNLGDGTNTDSNTPVLVQTPADVTFASISAGGDFSLAIGSDGNTYSWGNNSSGQLGDGTNTNSNLPLLVQTPAGVTFTNITTGGDFALTFGSDGKTYSWGNNLEGQLGDGTNVNRNAPAPVLVLAPVPEVVVTGITFGGLDGTNLADNGDETWSVDTPAHAAGQVDVVVFWTLGGVPQAPITYSSGFTYSPTPVAPTITNPGDQTVANGKTTAFSVEITGTPTATVTWEVSRDSGSTWEAITADQGATPSPDGLTLSIRGSKTNGGFHYRATATNNVGSATSQSARLTVTQQPVVTDPVDGPGTTNPGDNAGSTDKNVDTALEITGSDPDLGFLVTALVTLLLGAGLVTANLAARQRITR